MKKNVDLLLNIEGNLAVDDTEKAEVSNGFFTSVSTNKVSHQMTSAVGSQDREGKQGRVVKEQARDYLEKFDVFKSAGLHGIYPRARTLNHRPVCQMQPAKPRVSDPWGSPSIRRFGSKGKMAINMVTLPHCQNPWAIWG